MAQLNKNLRMFIRMDGSGRAVPGSGVLRLTKPKVGDWFEIPTYECCDPLQVVDTTTTTSTTSTSTSTTSTTTTAP